MTQTGNVQSLRRIESLIPGGGKLPPVMLSVAFIERARPEVDLCVLYTRCANPAVDQERAVRVLTDVKNLLVDAGYIYATDDAEYGFTPDNDGEMSIACMDGVPTQPCIYFALLAQQITLEKFKADVRRVVKGSEILLTEYRQ